ncbi:MAG: hypothetical protein SF172_13735 [Burkholderiales bacterium]|nr:hypothetical protein [Burkholderiales bacterium]
MLIMVDGQRTGAQLLEQAGELADQLASQLNDLIVLGFIEELRAQPESAPMAEQLIRTSSGVTTGASPSAKQGDSDTSAGTPSASLPTWTTVPLDVLKGRLGKMLTDSLGMRAMFLTAQLDSVRNHRDLEAMVDEMAQSLATSMGADAARKWRSDARAKIGIPG